MTDTERLDFILSNNGYVSLADEVFYFWVCDDEPIGEGNTKREAIDDAMKQSNKDKP